MANNWLRLEPKSILVGWTSKLPAEQYAAWVKFLLTVKTIGERGGRIKKAYFDDEFLCHMKLSRHAFDEMMKVARGKDIPAGESPAVADEGDCYVVKSWSTYQIDPGGAARQQRFRDRRVTEVTVTPVSNGCNADGTGRDGTGQVPPTPSSTDIFEDPPDLPLEFGGPTLPAKTPRQVEDEKLAAIHHIALTYADWQTGIDANPALRTMPTRWTTPIADTYRARGLEFIKLVTVDVLKAAYADSEGGKFMGWGKVEQYLDSDAYRSRQRRRDGPSISDAERSIEAAKKRETEYWAKRVADAKAKEQEKANASVEVPST